MPSDRLPLDYAKRAVATGGKAVEIPPRRLTSVSDEAVEETGGGLEATWRRD